MPVPAREYHERTKHTPESVRADSHRLDWENKPTPYKVYTDRPTVDLPDLDGSPEVPTLEVVSGEVGGAGDATPDLADVARLCHLSLGVTKVLDLGGREHAFRAAACTGALYHVDGYLVTGDLPDLDAGVYHFDPRQGALDVLRVGDYRGSLAAATGDHPAMVDSPLSVVLTSTWWRNAWKYRERTYRHAFWDSGTVLANLLAAAAGLDLPASVLAGFADGAVADLLGVDPTGEGGRAGDAEGPVAVVPVGQGAPVPDPPAVEPIDPGTAPLSPDPVEYDLIGAAYEASSLADGGSVRRWRERAPAAPLVSRGPGDGERVALDPVGPERAAKTPLPLTVRRRGSAREYVREDLSFRKVSTVLDRAVRGVPLDATAGRDEEANATATATAPLALNDCYLVVNGVEGVEPGAYQYIPGGGGEGEAGSSGGRQGGFLERLRPGAFRREAGHIALDQRLAADAALCVFFLTDLDAVTDALGERGYRAALLEAAVTAGWLYLAAYAHRDLGATGLTFYDDEVTEFFSPRAAGETPTFCWTLGRPA